MIWKVIPSFPHYVDEQMAEMCKEMREVMASQGFHTSESLTETLCGESDD